MTDFVFFLLFLLAVGTLLAAAETDARRCARRDIRRREGER